MYRAHCTSAQCIYEGKEWEGDEINKKTNSKIKRNNNFATLPGKLLKKYIFLNSFGQYKKKKYTTLVPYTMETTTIDFVRRRTHCYGCTGIS